MALPQGAMVWTVTAACDGGIPDHTHFVLVHSLMHMSLTACVPMSLPQSAKG